MQTSNGIKLDYHYIDKTQYIIKKNNNRKLSEEQITIINELYKGVKITQKNALIYLEKNHNIKISTTTYNKVIKGKY